MTATSPRTPNHLRPAPSQTKGLIGHPPQACRQQLTLLGRRVAVLSQKSMDASLRPGASNSTLTARSPLATAWRQLNRALDDYISCRLAPYNHDPIVNFALSSRTRATRRHA